MSENEEYSFSIFIDKFSKDFIPGDSYSCKALDIKPFIHFFSSAKIYNPYTFSPLRKVIFETNGNLLSKNITLYGRPDLTISSTSPDWEELENQKYIYDTVMKIKKPNYSRVLLLENHCYKTKTNYKNVV